MIKNTPSTRAAHTRIGDYQERGRIEQNEIILLAHDVPKSLNRDE